MEVKDTNHTKANFEYSQLDSFEDLCCCIFCVKSCNGFN
ncbi:hypothetical protein OROMI_001889 [Orobanche minor]